MRLNISKLCMRTAAAFLIVLHIASISTAGSKKDHAIKQVIGKVISINEITGKVVLSCRKVKHTIISQDLTNVSVGSWVVAKVDKDGDVVDLASRADKIGHCGEDSLIKSSEIKKAFIKDDMLLISNNNGRKKRIEIHHWMAADSPDKKTTAYVIGFYYSEEALVLITDRRGTVRHSIDASDSSKIRFLDDDIEWVNDSLLKVTGNVNNSIEQYLIFDAKKGTLLRSYFVSDCELSWSPAKDKIALCGFYPPFTPEEYQSNDLLIDETPMLPIKGKSLMDSPGTLGSIYPSETESNKEESERLVHKFKTAFLWSPDGTQLAFVDEIQQVGHDDESKILGQYLIIVNAIKKTTIKLPLPELTVDSENVLSDQMESMGWSKDGRFILLNNIAFDTRERLFLKK